ncbi:DUF2147 domain-containing protein [Zavarzinia sp. CC-PAN008]|uniref:DUF2147 domain-containing protein n=1 Tax=Zavarzinia sp. CC-PAN008 TaxID=3243332 RepID=UPI003F745AC9
MRAHVVAGLVALAALVGPVQDRVQADEMVTSPQTKIDGLWRMTPGTLVVALARCGENLCGKVAALGKGMARTDVLNPVPAEQTRALCGLPIMPAMRWDGYAWSGTLYDPQDGTVYSVALMPADDGTLSVYGNTGTGEEALMMRSFGRSETWTRLEVPPASCAEPNLS